MKFCTNCNHVLADSDLACPYCTGGNVGFSETAEIPPIGPEIEAPPDVAGRPPQEKPEETEEAAEQENKAEPADIMRITAAVQMARQSADRLWDDGSAKRAATTSFTLEIPLGQRTPGTSLPQEADGLLGGTTEIDMLSNDLANAQPDGMTEDFDFAGETDMDENTGAIERAMEGEAVEQALAPKRGLGKLEITLILILAAAVVVFGILIVVKLIKDNQPVQENYDFEQFVGTWVSDYFVFNDDENRGPVCCEQLIIKADGTFTRRYLVVNRAIPDGYLTDEWEVEEEISGRVEFLKDSRSLALIWDEGETIYYRYVLKLDSTNMTLREYYDDESFFDVEFTKMT